MNHGGEICKVDHINYFKPMMFFKSQKKKKHFTKPSERIKCGNNEADHILLDFQKTATMTL